MSIPDDRAIYPSEQILWTGQPTRYPVFDAGDVFLVPFTLIWCGFAIFWESSVIAGGAGSLFVVWGIPFVLVGLYMAVGRLVVRRLNLRSAHYYLTDQRVVITTGFPTKRTLSEWVAHLPPPVLKTRPDGSGSIAFGSFPTSNFFRTGMGNRGWGTFLRQDHELVLRDVPNAMGVCEMIVQAQRAGRAGGTD
ncbi:hypothetical protein J5X84_30110 [Streptosporangiaceae bacterium NEAU-GS5]|nr:hypothetical protein [Streptosporangiaceae bacterium NEAU-GS5]